MRLTIANCFTCLISIYNFLPMHAGIAAGVGRAFSRDCLYVCPRSKRKTAWAIITKLGTRILYSSRSACIDPEVKRSKAVGQRSKVQVSRYMVRKSSRSLVTIEGTP